MIDILKQVLPPELATAVFRFLAHPTAELFAPLILKHSEKVVRYRAWRERQQLSETAYKDCFALMFFNTLIVRRNRRARKADNAVGPLVNEIYFLKQLN
jgi:hypothetical protein